MFKKLKLPNKARTYYRKALTVDAEYDEAFFRIGETYKSEKRYREAISSIERASKIYPDNVYYQKALAEIYIILEEYNEAVKIYKELIESDGSKKWQWIDLATTLYQNDEKDESIEILDEAISRFKKKAELFYAKSAILYNLGKRKESIENLEQGLSLKFKHHYIIFAISNQMKSDNEVLNLIEQYKI
jgi:tetratricopeptide (TPR) repeat protein